MDFREFCELSAGQNNFEEYTILVVRLQIFSDSLLYLFIEKPDPDKRWNGFNPVANH